VLLEFTDVEAPYHAELSLCPTLYDHQVPILHPEVSVAVMSSLLHWPWTVVDLVGCGYMSAT
jgi:hypothetical protein